MIEDICIWCLKYMSKCECKSQKLTNPQPSFKEEAREIILNYNIKRADLLMKRLEKKINYSECDEEELKLNSDFLSQLESLHNKHKEY